MIKKSEKRRSRKRRKKKPSLKKIKIEEKFQRKEEKKDKHTGNSNPIESPRGNSEKPSRQR